MCSIDTRDLSYFSFTFILINNKIILTLVGNDMIQKTKH